MELEGVCVYYDNGKVTPGDSDDNTEWPFRGDVTVELLSHISDPANLDICGSD